MNKKTNSPTPLSEFEYDLLWMSIRYACGRRTIACSCFPKEIVKNWWHRISDGQKRAIYRDIKNELDFRNRIGGKEGFGNDLDNRVWQKFMSACNVDAYEDITLSDGSRETVFRANNVTYPLKSYIENPWADIFIPEDRIKKGE